MNKTVSVRLLIPILAALAFLILFSIVRADERDRNDPGKEDDAQAAQHAWGGEDGGNGKTEREDEREDDDDLDDTSASSSKDTESDEHGKDEEHRSKVADIVHKLQELARENHGIGDEVREVATEQASTSEDAARRIHDIESEGPIKVFLLGSDFRNVGGLRSALVTTQNHIDRLKKATEKVTDPQTKAELTAQIGALQETASSTQSFLEQHEQTFSLFGWFLRLIGR